jgi:tetratricopeptide (TPR) repeat protein
MLHALQIQKLLIELGTVKSPYDRVKLVKKAINIADAHNDTGWGFDLRKQIIAEEKLTSSCIEGLPAFTWILEMYERDPELCNESDFMVEYKWMIQAARRNADVSMEQFESIVEDYKTRLRRNGFSLHSYYTARAQMAFQQHKLEEAKEYLHLRKSEERDDLSFCLACEIHDLVEYELLSGNIAEIFVVGADLFAGKEYCKYTPFQTFCLCVNTLHDCGYSEHAEELFEIAEIKLANMHTVDMSDIGYVGRLICYLTKKDKNMAWNYFEKYLSWSINCEDYYNFQFSSGVLSLFKGSGTRRLNISSEIPWYNPSGVYELPVLYDYYKNQATTLAAKFDARNNCSNFTNELNSML